MTFVMIAAGVDVIVIVIVIEPVIVAVHVHGNDTVIVIQPVDDGFTDALVQQPRLSSRCCSSMGNDHAHGIVPVPVHVKDHGDDHDHDHDHDHRHELVMNRERFTSRSTSM